MSGGRRGLVSLALSWPAGLLLRGPAASDAPLPLSADDRVYLALSQLKSGFHCSQSVLVAYADVLSWPTDVALRVGAALAGGSTVGGECGAVAAGYLVLGARYGQTVPAFGDVESEEALFGRVRRFIDEFRKRHAAITCRELLGLDVFTREGVLEGRRSGRFAERCPHYVRDAVTIIESLVNPVQALPRRPL